MQGKRIERVATLVKHELGEALTKRLRDPRIGFVTVTEVKLSDDLKYAQVFYSVLGTDEEKQNTAKGLKKARGFLQHELAIALKLRLTPHLTFVLDSSLDQGMKIDRILKSIHEENTVEK